MRFIPTRVHGVIDYLFSLGLIGLAFYYGWQRSERWVAVGVGVAVIVYSLCTDYEMGVVRFLRVRFHLFLDAVSGLLLLASPFLFNFPVGSHRWPYVAFGVAALFFTFTTIEQAEGTAAK